MRFSPSRTRLLVRHLLLSLALLFLAGICAFRLFAFPPDPLAAAALPGLVASLILLPAVFYRILVLLHTSYEVTSAGALVIAMGSAREILPLDEILEIRSGAGIPEPFRSIAPGWRTAWQGRTPGEAGNPVEWFAADHGSKLLFIVTRTRILAISPDNPFQFANTVTELSTRGSLEKISPLSIRPGPFLSDILSYRPAILLLVGSLITCVGLGSLFIGCNPFLPENQFLKFDITGAPTSEGDPARLLLLPIAGGTVWVVNCILGWTAWRKGDRPAAFVLWIVSLLVGIGLWISAGFLLLSR